MARKADAKPRQTRSRKSKTESPSTETPETPSPESPETPAEDPISFEQAAEPGEPEDETLAEDAVFAEADTETDPEAVLPDWKFEASAADLALRNVRAQAEEAASREWNAELGKRRLTLACFDFITTLMPIAQLAPLKRHLDKDRSGEAVAQLPSNVQQYLRGANLPVCSFNSANPFGGIFYGFYVEAMRKHPKLEIEPADANEMIMEGGEDISLANMKKATIASNVARHRYGLILLAAIDMNRRDLIMKGRFRAVAKDYENWQKSNPTLMLPRPRVGRKSKATLDAEQQEREQYQKEERERREAAERRRQSGASSNPFASGGIADLMEATGETIDQPVDDQPETPVDESPTTDQPVPPVATPEPEPVAEAPIAEPAPKPEHVEPDNVVRFKPARVRMFGDVIYLPLDRDMLDQLPAEGTLSFKKEDGRLMIYGWQDVAKEETKE